jgi:hypothetical protein
MLKIKSNNLPINNFTIYAERHCGTNFLAKYIPLVYNSPIKGISGLQVTWDYGWKHWFGFEDEKIINNGQNTLFIGIVRNPYDWIAALKRMPHHLRSWNGKMNENPYKDMNDFLSSEVVSFHQDKEIIHDHHMNEYRRYKNIFELRETKNTYLYNQMPSIAQNYILINYEILHKDISRFIMSINDNFNILFKEFLHNEFDKRPYGLDNDTIKLINSNLNWNTENSLGYYAL